MTESRSGGTRVQRNSRCRGMTSINYGSLLNLQLPNLLQFSLVDPLQQTTLTRNVASKKLVPPGRDTQDLQNRHTIELTKPEPTSTKFR